MQSTYHGALGAILFVTLFLYHVFLQITAKTRSSTATSKRPPVQSLDVACIIPLALQQRQECESTQNSFGDRSSTLLRSSMDTRQQTGFSPISTPLFHQRVPSLGFVDETNDPWTLGPRRSTLSLKPVHRSQMRDNETAAVCEARAWLNQADQMRNEMQSAIKNSVQRVHKAQHSLQPIHHTLPQQLEFDRQHSSISESADNSNLVVGRLLCGNVSVPLFLPSNMDGECFSTNANECEVEADDQLHSHPLILNEEDAAISRKRSRTEVNDFLEEMTERDEVQEWAALDASGFGIVEPSTLEPASSRSRRSERLVPWLSESVGARVLEEIDEAARRRSAAKMGCKSIHGSRLRCSKRRASTCRSVQPELTSKEFDDFAARRRTLVEEAKQQLSSAR